MLWVCPSSGMSPSTAPPPTGRTWCGAALPRSAGVSRFPMGSHQDLGVQGDLEQGCRPLLLPCGVSSAPWGWHGERRCRFSCIGCPKVLRVSPALCPGTPGLMHPCALCPQWFAAPGLMSSTEGWLRRDTHSPTGCPCASPVMKASCCVVMLRPGVRPTAPGSRRCPPASQVGLAFGCSTARCCLLLQLPWCLLPSRAVLPFVNPSCTPWGCNFALMFGFVTL